MSSYWIYGLHVVQAALNNQKRVVEELVFLEKINTNLNIPINTKVIIKNKKFFNSIINKDENSSGHQGIAAKIKPLEKINLKDIVKNDNLNTILALDQICDPRNIGSIIRSCIAFNVNHLIIESGSTNFRTNTIHKASSGYIEKISIIEVSNINNAILELQKKNFFIYGMDSHSGKELNKIDVLKKKLILLGSEAKGLRKNVTSKCDQLIKIKTTKESESLNVANATTVMLYEIYNQSFNKSPTDQNNL